MSDPNFDPRSLIGTQIGPSSEEETPSFDPSSLIGAEIGRSPSRVNLAPDKIYEGMTFGEAQRRLEALKQTEGYQDNPDFLYPFIADTMPDPETGQRVRVFEPSASTRKLDPIDFLTGGVFDSPEEFSQRPATIPTGDRVIGAVSNAGRNLTQFGADVIDYFSEGDTNLGNRVGESIPRSPEGDTFSDVAVNEAVPALVGIGVVDRTLRALRLVGRGISSLSSQTAERVRRANILQNHFGQLGIRGAERLTDMASGVISPQLVRRAATAFLGEVGAAAALDPDTETLLIGPNANFSEFSEEYFQTLGRTANGDPEAGERLAGRVAILTEAMAGAGLVGGGVAIAQGAATTMFLPLIAFARGDETVENTVVEQILTRLASYQGAGRHTPEEVDAIKRDLVNMIRNGSGEIQRISQQYGPELARLYDEMAAQMQRANDPVLQRRLARQRGQQRPTPDTMTSLQIGAGDRLSQEASSAADSLRSGALVNPNSGTRTATATGRPATMFERGTIEGENTVRPGDGVAAGNEAIYGAGEELADQARDAIDGQAGRVTQAEADLADAETNLRRLAENDPILAQQLQELEQLGASRVGERSAGARGRMSNSLVRAYEVMTDEKNRLYKEITGGVVDGDLVFRRIQSLPSGVLNNAVSTLNNTNPLRRLVLESTPRDIQTGVDAAGNPVFVKETPSQVGQRLTKFFEDNGYDYGTFYQDVRTDLNQIAQDYFSSSLPSDKAAARELRSFVDFIDTDLLNRAAQLSNDLTLISKMDAAVNNYRDWASVWRSEQFAPIADTFEMTLRRQGQDPARMARTAQETVERSLRTTVSEEAGAFSRLLSRPESRGNPQDITDYIMGKVVEDSWSQIQREGISSIDPAQIAGNVRTYSTMLRQQGHSQQADQLDSFVDRLFGQQNRIGTLQNNLESARRSAAARIDQVRQEELRNFIQVSGKDFDLIVKGTDNPYNAFRKVFQNEDTRLSTLRALRDRAAGNPIVLDGLQTALFRYMRSPEGLMNATREQGGNLVVNSRRFNQETEGTRKFLEDARVVFEGTEREALFDGLLSLYRLSGDTAQRRAARPVAAGSPTAYYQQANAVVDRFINFTLGPLNRMATRLKAGSRIALEQLDKRMGAESVTDAILADPDYFVAVFDRVNSRGGLDQRTVRQFWRGIRRSTPLIIAEMTDQEIEDQFVAEVFEEAQTQDALFPESDTTDRPTAEELQTIIETEDGIPGAR